MQFEIAADVSEDVFDVVNVGAGIAGSVLAKSLALKNWRVLVLEAGTSQSMTQSGYRDNLDRYYAADAKVPNAPYKANLNVPQSDVLAVRGNDDASNSAGYFIQAGALPFRSDSVRQGGGTTLHWLGTCLRMLPADFELWHDADRFATWPLRYHDLKAFYARAEREIGVSADIADQRALAAVLEAPELFDDHDQYPMQKMPQSHVDKVFSAGLEGAAAILHDHAYPLHVTSTPQGRNGMPNPAYPGGYSPVGAVGNPDLGQRCQGNSSCVPICPIQAKYNALKSLSVGIATGRVRTIVHAVASKLYCDEAGAITGVDYQAYDDPGEPTHRIFRARARHYVLAASPVENVKLLMMSNLGGSAAGWYLMDHPVMLTWGLAHERLGTFRGPGSTSGIETLRDGGFRAMHSAFRIEIDNWGWNWAKGAPWDTALALGWTKGLSGRPLRDALFDQVQRQVRLGFLMEVPPVASNQISIDRSQTDPLGNPRPVIRFDLPDYTKPGMAAAKSVSDTIFKTLGIEDHTDYSGPAPGRFEIDGTPYVYQGAGHVIGGHVMGNNPNLSVVDRDQRCWGHPNLWLVGCGNMPSEGTSNPTLTMTAMTFMAAERIDAALGGEGAR